MWSRWKNGKGISVSKEIQLSWKEIDRQPRNCAFFLGPRPDNYHVINLYDQERSGSRWAFIDKTDREHSIQCTHDPRMEKGGLIGENGTTPILPDGSKTPEATADGYIAATGSQCADIAALIEPSRLVEELEWQTLCRVSQS